MRPPPRSQRLPTRTVSACLASCLLASSAWALDEPVLRADAHLGYAGYVDDRRYHGMLVGLESAYTFDDFWGVRAGYGFGVHRGKSQAFETHQVSLGGRYQFDVFHFVPWLDLSPTVYLVTAEGGPGEGLHVGVAAGLGFDRLLDESWSVGAAFRYHQIFGQERFPAYFTACARLGYRWTFGDPFAP